MDIAEIKTISLITATFLNFAFAFVILLKGKTREARYLSATAFFAAIYCFLWVAVYSPLFPNKLFWIKLTWAGYVSIAANMIFTYVFTGKTNFFKLKLLFWYGLTVIITFFSLYTPYIINIVSDSYPFIIPESAGRYNDIPRILVIFGLTLCFIYLIISYRKSPENKRLQIKYIITGLSIYSGGSIIFAGILPFISPRFYSFMDVSAMLSVAWMGLATYAIIKEKLYDIKIILTELFLGILATILFVQIFISENLQARIIQTIIFLLFCFIGYLLIKATHKEILKEQEAKQLANELSDLNSNLEKRVQKKTQELQINVLELEKEKNKTLSIINNFADGLLFFNDTNSLALINPQARNFLKINKEETTDKMQKILAKSSTFKPVISLLSKPTFRKELPLNDLILEVSSVPVNKEGTLIILHDITREKRIENMKSEFVSVAAHQLRTPLSGINWALNMLLKGDLGKLKKEQKDFLEKSYNSNRRMITLVNDLLNVAKIEEGKFIYNIKKINMKELTRKICDSFKDSAKKKKIKLTVKQPTQIPEIVGDQEKISTAVENLIDNAVQYTPNGGKITVSLKSNADNVEFSIADTGVGIKKSQQDRVFKKFFRGDNVVPIDTDGTGLGLFIVKNIIEAHDGKIWFESEENKGTIFYFSLPINK